MKLSHIKKSKIKISKSHLSGSISTSPSKSQTMRAILFAALAEGESKIHNYLPSKDTFSMINVIKILGAKVKILKKTLKIQGTSLNFKKHEKLQTINAENSGIILRFLSPLLALKNSPYLITGDDSVKKNREIYPLIKGLKDLKVSIKFTSIKNRPPFLVKGPVKHNTIKISGEDSQPVSAFLISSAFAPFKTKIFIKNPGEKPWIDLTLSWLDFFNIKYKRKAYSYFEVFGNSKIKGFIKKIENDFSSLAYPIIAALITNSEILIKNVNMNAPIGDRKLLYTLQKMGANIKILKNSIKVKKNSKLKSSKIDVNDFIDALPILAVLGCFMEEGLYLYNCKIARKKESDRPYAITKELKKLNANITEKKDSLLIKKSNLKGALVSSHNDHRIAMSLIVAALNAKGSSYITNINCIEKSYPKFLEDFKKLNANIENL